MTSDFSVNMNEYLPLRDVVFNTLRDDPETWCPGCQYHREGSE